MDVDALELNDKASASSEGPNDRLNAMVAVTVAVLATFMGICKVKDDNIVQAMQQAQADKIDQWAFYQARNLREEVAQATVDTLTLGAAVAATPAQTEAIARYADLAKREDGKKHEAQQKAEQAQKDYDELNRHDDQFDLSDALLDISISLLAVTALTRKRWLYWIALVPTVFGILMGLAGLLGWSLHPDALTNLLQ
ncbi:MAG TPA: DUF4337 domain-containing protein [Dokdonella sp.]